MKEIKNFAIIEGKAVIKDSEIIFNKSIDSINEEKNITGVEIRTDVNFSNGIIEFDANFKDTNSGCLIVFKKNDGEIAVAGFRRDSGKFIIPDNNGYLKAGELSNYNLKETIHFKIEAIGSSISLFINNVLMLRGEASLSEAPITLKVSGLETKITNLKYKAIIPKVFVVMQFTDEYNVLYSDVIKPICESFDLECVRADEFYSSTPILKDIIDSIKRAYIIIAEITPDNPNVFYEIGYAHAINKPTILLCDKKKEKLPFDISGFRTLFYENSIGGKNKVEKDLRMFIGNILK